MIAKSRLTLTTILLIGIVMTIISANVSWGKERWKGILEADAKGYYAYLPALFIYQDLNFQFFDQIEREKYYSENLFYEYRAVVDGHTINKYYCGTAVAQLPFFLIAHSFSTEKDGYSKGYPIATNLAAIFYLMVGLFFLNLILIRFGLTDGQKTLTTITAVFGTNLFFYSMGEPGMSHIYSFAFIAMFLHFGFQFFASHKAIHLILLGLLLGIITLIRPVNGLVVLALPFAAGSSKALWEGCKQAFRVPWGLAGAAFGFLSMIGIQLVLYKLSTGSFWVYAYGEETFHFASPHMLDMLFSYRKGLFLYTPVFLLSCVGFWFLWRANKFQFASLLLFLVFLTYILSSWWMWYYGGSFSSRVFVEYIPFFMVLLGLTLNRLQQKPLKIAHLVAIGLLIVLCQIQTYQYRYYQIHWSEMNKEKYWDVFLRIDRL